MGVTAGRSAGLAFDRSRLRHVQATPFELGIEQSTDLIHLLHIVNLDGLGGAAVEQRVILHAQVCDACAPVGRQRIECLRIISYGYIFFAWGMVTVQCFNGAGDTMTPTWVNLFCFWLFQIPLAYYLALPAGMGPRGVYWAIAISYSLSAMIGLFLFRLGRWKSREV